MVATREPSASSAEELSSKPAEGDEISVRSWRPARFRTSGARCASARTHPTEADAAPLRIHPAETILERNWSRQADELVVSTLGPEPIASRQTPTDATVASDPQSGPHVANSHASAEFAVARICYTMILSLMHPPFGLVLMHAYTHAFLLPLTSQRRRAGDEPAFLLV